MLTDSLTEQAVYELLADAHQKALAALRAEVGYHGRGAVSSLLADAADALEDALMASSPQLPW